MRIIAFFCCLLLSTISYSQVKKDNSNSQKIINLLGDYFKLDRENLHVQFNKDVYTTNEIIGCKGYVLSFNSEVPQSNTTNVNLVVYDDNNQVVRKQLIYADKGTFSYSFKLDASFKSGIYHFRFYTNWMNNFNEDYSFTQTIEIINRDEPYVFKSKEPLWKTAKVAFYPVSGKIIDNIYNTIGVKITDCNQKGIEVNDVLILDSKSNEVARFNTNRVGNGSFTFIADQSEKYTLKINNDKLKLTQPLPPVVETGIAISYNNNLPKNKLAISIKTNEKGIPIFNNKTYTLLIHQNEKSILKEFSFANTETEHVLFFDKINIANGVNSIRLIDENLHQVSERLLYHYGLEKTSNSLQTIRTRNDSIKLSGKSDFKNANLSVSVLPAKNICKLEQKSIFGTFYLNNYLKNPEPNNYFYFDPQNNNRKQDMEALMLVQNQNKFSWDDFKTKIPKIVYPFNKGVTVSGKIETDTNLKSKGKITLISTKNQVFEDAMIKPNGDFKFENFFAQDSTVFVLQVTNDKGVRKHSRIETHVIQNESDFVFPLQIPKKDCPVFVESKPEEKFTFSKNFIELASVSITLDTKKILVNKDLVSNMATGYKIDEEYGTIMDYLNGAGYRTGIDNETGEPFVRSVGGFNKDVRPTFRIDNNPIADLNELYSIYLSDVDEIYFDNTNTRYIGSRVVIDIFLKKGIVRKSNFKVKHDLFMVTKGYANNTNFKNAYFETDKEYALFGTLNWSPTILLEDNPNYELRFPREGQKEIQVLIEGFSNDGQLVSEMQRITVE
ncbi:hypothetical protein [Flavobacterium faecale]|uniref:hypothetical protein n=1 Tax=Flavobacterium faecale TaxID=1355330 RepID=UPI003AAC5CDB